jgi:hypothetical protein
VNASPDQTAYKDSGRVGNLAGTALRREVNVAVEPVQTVDSALESGEKTAVQVFTPMGRQNGVGCCLGGEAMGEVVHLGVRDVPALMDG